MTQGLEVGGRHRLEKAALLVIDVQNGFIDWELPVAGGAEVVPLINGLLPRFEVVIASQDWHPARHGSFASQHEGALPFQLGTLSGAPQVLWPDHCVQGTPGAAFHPDLHTQYFQAIIRKGADPRVDSYSVFYDNHRQNPSGLTGLLRARGVERIYVCGLAFDYCVLFSAVDALEVTSEVYVIEDACRAVAPSSEAEARSTLESKGIRCVKVAEVMAL